MIFGIQKTVFHIVCKLCLLLALVGCDAPAPKERTGERTIFSVSEPSRLFFLNTRVNSYYLERQKGMDVNIYRFRKFSRTAQRPVLVPVIIHAWLKNEAYIFIRPNDYPKIANPLTIRSSSSEGSQTYRLDMPTRPAQDSFAHRLYMDVRAGSKLAVMLRDRSFEPFLDSRAERSYFLAVMRDYYRLTDRM